MRDPRLRAPSGIPRPSFKSHRTRATTPKAQARVETIKHDEAEQKNRLPQQCAWQAGAPYLGKIARLLHLIALPRKAPRQEIASRTGNATSTQAGIKKADGETTAIGLSHDLIAGRRGSAG